jgi:type VI secretion system protein ImpL
MAKFFSSAVVRAILAFLAFILAALAVWFIGPLLALGEWRPLAGVGLRITTLCLMLVFVIFALLGWSLSAIGVTCLCLLVWHAGPLLALGPWRPLEPVLARALTVGVIALVYAVWAVWRLWKLMRDDAAFAARILGRDKHAPKELARDEVREVSAIVHQSVAQLRRMHLTVAGGAGFAWAWMRRVVEGKRYLYELPWYMIIGSAGVGKTSVLLNSGLKFPVGEQMGAASAQRALAQNAGTLNCAWWFTNEAVLIDTAGRYTHSEQGPTAADALPAPSASQQARPAVPATPGEPAAPAPAPPPPTHLKDAAEWRGFLGVLRRVRPRAPINGALVAVDVAQLLGDDDSQTVAHAARLRARLAELRQELGIRFPVYVVLTKTDLLRGFSAYFSSLTTEARAQVWGFTLPWMAQEPGDATPLVARAERELLALHRRIADGVAIRLQEEFDPDRRQALYVLPHELRALVPRLLVLLDAMFSDSRYDTTQTTHTLRGVYFTSAMQYDKRQVSVDRQALASRLRRTLAGLLVRTPRADGMAVDGEEAAEVSLARASGTRSFFMADVLSRVVFPEAHLVKPNLQWEARFRLLRLAGHALVFVLFGWLASALVLSHANNRAYLADVAARTDALVVGLRKLATDQGSTNRMIEALDMAHALPAHSGLDLAAPSLAYLYGLYAAEPIVEAARATYGSLQDRLILPVLTRRMEAVMREAVQAGDTERAHDTLYVYLLLHDKARYTASPQAAQAVRSWVIDDWQEGLAIDSEALEEGSDDGAGLAASFGNSSAMIAHLEDMFSSQRAVQSATVQDEGLVRMVRAFLDATSRSERLYQRTKAALMPDAPHDFTLVRALGPQVGTIFSRASGDTLERGVPGFFTYDGYHALFAKRLPEMVAVAMKDDAWVMGRDPAGTALSEGDAQALVEDIRRQYLTEYADAWTEFLADVRVIGAESGGSLAFELNVLRQLAAPDSPLTRLGRMAARETTLSRSLKTPGDEEKSLFDKATEQVGKKAAQVGQDLGLHPEQRAQRQLVDERFAALREVVTGQREGMALPGGKPALDGIANLLNEYYTALVVADAAISAGALPPAGVEAATKMKIEAGKLPAPFREVLLGIGASGSRKVAEGAASILRVQAQAQMDRLIGILALTVGEPCQRNLAGRYPFAASMQEVAVDDFNAMFASGGAADEYFNKYLAPLVDTSARPWKYKTPALASAENPAGGQAPVAAAAGPTLTGELLKLLAAHGPNPDFFAQVGQIREAYFKEPGARRMAWKLDVSVQALEANVMELLIDLDGQVQRYAHGPVQALQVQWPGPRGGTMAEIGVQPRIKADSSVISSRGPWALLRLMERGRVTAGASAGRVAVEFQFDGRRAVLDVGSSGVNPLSSKLLQNFTCPLRSA